MIRLQLWNEKYYVPRSGKFLVKLKKIKHINSIGYEVVHNPKSFVKKTGILCISFHMIDHLDSILSYFNLIVI